MASDTQLAELLGQLSELSVTDLVMVRAILAGWLRQRQQLRLEELTRSAQQHAKLRRAARVIERPRRAARVLPGVAQQSA